MTKAQFSYNIKFQISNESANNGDPY